MRHERRRTVRPRALKPSGAFGGEGKVGGSKLVIFHWTKRSMLPADAMLLQNMLYKRHKSGSHKSYLSRVA